MASGSTTPQIMKQGTLTPWLYLGPSLLVMTVFIIYPLFNTVTLSLLDKDSAASAATTCGEGPCWGIFENYRYALTAELDSA